MYVDLCIRKNPQKRRNIQHAKRKERRAKFEGILNATVGYRTGRSAGLDVATALNLACP